MTENTTKPLCISVIIPCYNHGKFLKKAVESVQSQHIAQVEIIVVDDGSTDNTHMIATNLDVQYIKQENSGLSSARNTGIKHCKGDLLVFLDADDWLLPKSLEINREILIEQPGLAFVSGAYKKVFENRGITSDKYVNVDQDHYSRMLLGNYIGMHAAVMYRRWVFDEFLYDTSLRMCEDYDLFLRVMRKYPVAHHSKKIAAYRIHGSNMSDASPKMLEAALHVLKRQKKLLKTEAEKQTYKNGRRFWIKYYTNELYMGIQSRRNPLSLGNIYFLLKYKPTTAIKAFIKVLLRSKST